KKRWFLATNRGQGRTLCQANPFGINTIYERPWPLAHTYLKDRSPQTSLRRSFRSPDQPSKLRQQNRGRFFRRAACTKSRTDQRRFILGSRANLTSKKSHRPSRGRSCARPGQSSITRPPAKRAGFSVLGLTGACEVNIGLRPARLGRGSGNSRRA